MTARDLSAVSVSLDKLAELFSVVILVDSDLVIEDASAGFWRHLPSAQLGDVLTEHVDINRPADVRSAQEIRHRENSLFLLVANAGNFALRGQFLELDSDRLIFAGAPWLGWLNRYAPDYKLTLADFAPADVQLDQLFYMSTERQMVQDLERLAAELQEANDAAKRANQAKSAFFAMMSHEMRTPLNGVVMGLSLLEDIEAGPQQKRLVQLVQSSARNMLTIINDLLDLSRLEAGQLELEPVLFDLDELVADIAELHAIPAEQTDVVLRTRVSGNVRGEWLADAGKLRQILVNLVSNALRFTAGGEVSICVSLAGQRLRFEVADTGTGIAPEDHEHIFDQYFTRPSPDGESCGTGLGLNLVQRLVSLMKGDIGFESELKVGTRFWFEVPAERSAPVQPGRNSRRLSISRIGGRVLLVEDNPTNRMLARIMLRQLGAEVETASNGIEAVEMATGDAFDLILMDISMPQLDGTGATIAIREQLGAKAPPIVALTAHSGDEARYRDAGMVDVLTKPVTRENLAETLAAHLLTTGDSSSGRQDYSAQDKESEFSPQILEKLRDEIGAQNLGQVVDLFLADMQQRRDSIQSTMSAGSASDVASHCHALRSSALSVGCKGLAEALRELEVRLRAGEPPMPQDLPRLLDKFDRAELEIEQWRQVGLKA